MNTKDLWRYINIHILTNNKGEKSCKLKVTRDEPSNLVNLHIAKTLNSIRHTKLRVDILNKTSNNVQNDQMTISGCMDMSFI